MAVREPKDLLSMLADRGEEAAARRPPRGKNHPPAAEVAAVRDAPAVHPPPRRLAVGGPADRAGPPAREDSEGRPQVRDLPAERLRRLVRALGDRAAHAGARHVREPRVRLAAAPRAVADAAEVDLARAPGAGDLDGVLEPMRDPVRADEVPAGPAREHRHLDVAAARDAVRDLVHRAVAADDDEE